MKHVYSQTPLRALLLALLKLSEVAIKKILVNTVKDVKPNRAVPRNPELAVFVR